MYRDHSAEIDIINQLQIIIGLTFLLILVPNFVTLSSIVLDFGVLCNPTSVIISDPICLTSLKVNMGVCSHKELHE